MEYIGKNSNNNLYTFVIIFNSYLLIIKYLQEKKQDCLTIEVPVNLNTNLPVHQQL